MSPLTGAYSLTMGAAAALGSARAGGSRHAAMFWLARAVNADAASAVGVFYLVAASGALPAQLTWSSSRHYMNVVSGVRL